MLDKHGFFIPNSDYLVNLEGMLKYIGEKVNLKCKSDWFWKRMFNMPEYQIRFPQRKSVTTAYDRQGSLCDTII